MTQSLFHLTFLLLLVVMTLASNLQTKQVIVMTRHGARAPMYQIMNYDDWMIQYADSQLTLVGQRQHYLLGTFLKDKYSDFLSEYYHEQEVQVYSTISTRAVQSVQSLLLGLFPKNQDLIVEDLGYAYQLPAGYQNNSFLQRKIKELQQKTLPHRYQPVPIEAPYSDTNELLEPSNVCGRISDIKQQARKGNEMKDFENSLWESGFYGRFIDVFEQDLTKINVSTEKNIPHSDLNVTVVGWFYDSINCNIYFKMPLPEKLTENLIKEILYVYDVQNLWINFPTEEAKQLYSNPIMTKISQVLQDIAFNSGQNKVVIFSGHDTNLNGALQFLGMMEGTFSYELHENDREKIRTNSPFASSIIYELQQDLDDNNYFLEIIFNGEVMKQPYCDNKTQCPLEEFLNFLERSLISHEEWQSQCESSRVRKLSE